MNQNPDEYCRVCEWRLDLCKCGEQLYCMICNRSGPRHPHYDRGIKVERYETKDSGKRAEFESGMVRDTDEGKARFDLIIPENVPYEDQLLTRFANLMERGARKYDARNWEKANSLEELARAKSSAFRHFMQWFTGEDDEDHAAAVLFNIMVADTVKLKMSPGWRFKNVPMYEATYGSGETRSTRGSTDSMIGLLHNDPIDIDPLAPVDPKKQTMYRGSTE